MFKNGASQKIQLFAFDTTTNLPKTGDAANITAYVSKDHGAVTQLTDTSATEMDATNAKGVYVFDLTQSETNADELTFTGKSSTANISITPRFISTNPTGFTSSVAQTGDSYARIGPAVGSPTQTITEDLNNIWLDTNDIQSRLPAALVSGRMDASVGAYASGQAPLQPTVAGRTLDVTAAGEAGIDWANIGGATSAVNLSGTTIKTATDVETDTQDIQGRLPAALVSGRMDSSVGAMQNDVLTAAATAADFTTEVTAGLSTLTQANIRTAVGLASANLDTQIGTLATASALSTVGSNVTSIKTVTDLLQTMIEAGTGSPTYYRFTVGAVELAPTGGSAPSAATIADAVWDEARAGHVSAGSFGEGVLVSDKTGFSLSTAGYAAAADKLLGRNLAGGSDGTRTVQDALRSLRNKTSISGGTLTVCQEDDTTTAWTAAVTTTAGDPLSSIDPA